jgi:hypothetical protein
MGGRGVKKYQKLRDVIYGRPLSAVVKKNIPMDVTSYMDAHNLSLLSLPPLLTCVLHPKLLINKL